jgi:hypothetical protein
MTGNSNLSEEEEILKEIEQEWEKEIGADTWYDWDRITSDNIFLLGKKCFEKALSLQRQENEKSNSKSDVIEKSVTSMDANKVPDKSTDMDRRKLLVSLQEKIEIWKSNLPECDGEWTFSLDDYEELSKIFKEMGQ